MRDLHAPKNGKIEGWDTKVWRGTRDKSVLNNPHPSAYVGNPRVRFKWTVPAAGKDDDGNNALTAGLPLPSHIILLSSCNHLTAFATNNVHFFTSNKRGELTGRTRGYCTLRAEWSVPKKVETDVRLVMNLSSSPYNIILL